MIALLKPDIEKQKTVHSRAKQYIQKDYRLIRARCFDKADF